jgi:hypothetical protein
MSSLPPAIAAATAAPASIKLDLWRPTLLPDVVAQLSKEGSFLTVPPRFQRPKLDKVAANVSAICRIAIDALCGDEGAPSVCEMSVFARDTADDEQGEKKAWPFAGDVLEAARRLSSGAAAAIPAAGAANHRQSVAAAWQSVSERFNWSVGNATVIVVARPWDGIARALVAGTPLGTWEHGSLGSGIYFSLNVAHHAAGGAGSPSAYRERPGAILIGLVAVGRVFPAIMSDTQWLHLRRKPPAGYDAVFSLVQHRWPSLGCRGWWPVVPEDTWQDSVVVPHLAIFTSKQFTPLCVLHTPDSQQSND